MKQTKIVDPQNARSGDYRLELERIQESGICPFCAGGDTLKRQEMLAWNESFFLTNNYVPYPNTEHHLLIIPVRHIVRLDQVTTAEMREMMTLLNTFIDQNEVKGGILFCREGQTEVTGATVCHLHWNYFVPKPGKIVEVFFGSQPR